MFDWLVDTSIQHLKPACLSLRYEIHLCPVVLKAMKNLDDHENLEFVHQQDQQDAKLLFPAAYI